MKSITGFVLVGMVLQIGQVLSRNIEKRAAPTCTSELRTYNPNHILCRESHPEATNKGVSASDKTLIVNLHNKYRSSVSPTAKTMYKIYWDDTLAVLAQKAAEICDSSKTHINNDRLREHGASTYGENLGFNPENWEAAVNSWYAEKTEFTLGVGGTKVGHYTQMMRNVTGRIGCGYANCPSPIGKSYVCKYISGQMDFKNPYLAGTPCSECPNKCKDNMCDCGGILCLNYGVINWETCTCTCTRAFTGPTCETPNCAVTDNADCTNSTKAGYCKYGNWANYCPKFCKVCQS